MTVKELSEAVREEIAEWAPWHNGAFYLAPYGFVESQLSVNLYTRLVFCGGVDHIYEEPVLLHAYDSMTSNQDTPVPMAMSAMRAWGVVGVASSTSSSPYLVQVARMSPVSSSGMSGTSRPEGVGAGWVGGLGGGIEARGCEAPRRGDARSVLGRRSVRPAACGGSTCGPAAL